MLQKVIGRDTQWVMAQWRIRSGVSAGEEETTAQQCPSVGCGGPKATELAGKEREHGQQVPTPAAGAGASYRGGRKLQMQAQVWEAGTGVRSGGRCRRS